MSDTNSTASETPPAASAPGESGSPPGGLSAVELAAKRGLGPMSELGQEVWHGQSRPCITCGQLVGREDTVCGICGQDLSADMVARMQAYAGPWYVHEHVRPFPGVSLDRLIRQVRRGVLTKTTIVRGPTTHHQWRFAAETPGLSKHLGACWRCQAAVVPSNEYCPSCDAYLDDPSDEPVGEAPLVQQTLPSQLDRLSSAVAQADAPAQPRDRRRRVAGIPVGAFIAAFVVVMILCLVIAAKIREGTQPAGRSRPTSAMETEVSAVRANAGAGGILASDR